MALSGTEAQVPCMTLHSNSRNLKNFEVGFQPRSKKNWLIRPKIPCRVRLILRQFENI